MVARVLTIEHADTSRRDEVKQRLEQEVVPFLRQQQGFAGYIALAREDGRGLAVVLWETQEHADAVEEVARARREQMSGELGFGIVSTDLYEAIVVELAR